MNNWHDIWSRKKTDTSIASDVLSPEQQFMKLKALMGIDTIGDRSPRYLDFINQFNNNIKEMTCLYKNDNKKQSFFDLGCGAGAYLYYLSSIAGECLVGGVDYSAVFIDIAKKIVKDPLELYCAEAIDLKVDIKYDYVYSRSIFQYFPDEAYARDVVYKMLNKSNRCVGVFDVHDLSKKDDFISFRRKTIPDFDTKYETLKHLFLPQTMFLDIANECNCDIKFAKKYMNNYWNSPYTFDVYFFKR